MRILDRYITRNFVGVYAYCLALFSILYIIIDIFSHLDEILRAHMPILTLQEYYLSMLPFIIIYISPVSALIATIYIIGNMNRSDEIVAMRAAGISINRILSPLFYTGLAISIAIFLISEKVLPVSMKNANVIREAYIEKSPQQKKENKKAVDNIALYGKNNDLIFIKQLDTERNIAREITILKQDGHGNVISKLDAREGVWKDNKWILQDVLSYKLDRYGMIEETPVFKNNAVLEIENPHELVSKGAYYEFMSFKELMNYMRNFSNVSLAIVNRLKVDLHQKISLPLTNLVLIIIGAAFAIRIRRRGRAATMIGMGISAVIGFIYYAFMAVCIALGKASILPPFIAAHLANILFGLAGLAMVKD